MRGTSAAGDRRWTVVSAAALVMVLSGGAVPEAHKAITSKYTYNEHVFPILKNRCGRCHFEGGSTPMSLLSYRDAVPWAESIREQLVAGAMPPWFVDPLGPAVRNAHPITPREMDALITWAVGGTPEGDGAAVVGPAVRPRWSSGSPDATFEMPAEHTLGVGLAEDVYDFTIRTAFGSERWVTSVDLHPGTPSLVRSATVVTGEGQILGAWVAGDGEVRAPRGTAFRLAPDSQIRVQIRYRKHWRDETRAVSDRSTLGVYFDDAPAAGRTIESRTVEVLPSESRGSVPVGAPLGRSVRILGVLPVLREAYAGIAVDAVMPTGRRLPLLRLQAVRPDWTRRYWLAEPVELPADAQIEVQVTPDSGPAAVPWREPLHITLDWVPL